MMVVCKDRLDRIRVDQRPGAEASAAVESDINALLAPKSYDSLVLLQTQVQAKLTSGEPIDVDYWENLLRRLLVWKAKAKLRAFHEVVLRNRLEQLRKRQRDEARQAQDELLARAARRVSAAEAPANALAAVEDAAEPYERGMSPPLITVLGADERDLAIVAMEDELRELVCLVVFFATGLLTATAACPTSRNRRDALRRQGATGCCRRRRGARSIRGGHCGCAGCR
jgi:uncharacterized protein with von Willebrand factor type A (vWA) domain